MSSLKRWRSSARSMASGEVPRIGTPASRRGTASLSGVWPPNWTTTPSGRSFSAMLRTSDRLYFEPLTLEDVLNIAEKERPLGVVVQFGGQTPLKLAVPLREAGVPILGTTSL